MQKDQKQNLKESRSHGTSLFPCALYLSMSCSVRLRVEHHWHKEIELIYLKKGKFKVSINTEYYDAEQECFFFINPGQLHDIRSTSHDYEEQAVLFDPQMLHFQTYDSIDEYVIQPLIQGTLTFPRMLDVTHPAFPAFRKEYERITEAFCRNQQTPASGDQICTNHIASQMQIKGSLLQMLALLMDQELMCHTAKPENQRIESIKTVLAYISRHYPERIYIQDLASLVNMNSQYFCRFFKKAIGKPPIDYLNDFRLAKVMQLLETTDMPIMEISLECGFNNIGNFQRLFKRKAGITPLQYRKNSRRKKSK